jgi:hypothetical protein
VSDESARISQLKNQSTKESSNSVISQSANDKYQAKPWQSPIEHRELSLWGSKVQKPKDAFSCG